MSSSDGDATLSMSASTRRGESEGAGRGRTWARSEAGFAPSSSSPICATEGTWDPRASEGGEISEFTGVGFEESTSIERRTGESEDTTENGQRSAAHPASTISSGVFEIEVQRPVLTLRGRDGLRSGHGGQKGEM